MGCSCTRDEARVIVNQQLGASKSHFTIKIHIPGNEKIKLILYEGKKDYMLLSDLFNDLAFCSEYGEELDANFMSSYLREKDDFIYFIQRLCGVVIENEEDPTKGKLWMPYINKHKYDWSFLCSNNRIVKRGDEIELKFESYSD
jgi:hypothetical protein